MAEKAPIALTPRRLDASTQSYFELLWTNPEEWGMVQLSDAQCWQVRNRGIMLCALQQAIQPPRRGFALCHGS